MTIAVKQELESTKPLSMIQIFDLPRWHATTAIAWVLSRNDGFTQACARKGLAGDARKVQLDAEVWRRAAFLRPEYNSAARGPIMLFPSAEAAWQRLQGELGSGDEHYSRVDVIARFPALTCPDRRHLMASLWHANDPASGASIPLSHGAWWVASKGGTQPVVLDDWKGWKSTFELLRRHLITSQIPIVDGQGRVIPPRTFAVVTYDYPCSALSPSPFVPGRHTYVACRLEAADGDQFFESGNSEPTWSGLRLSSAEFIRVAFRPDEVPGNQSATTQSLPAGDRPLERSAVLDEAV